MSRTIAKSRPVHADAMPRPRPGRPMAAPTPRRLGAGRSGRRRSERGQATAEYALVMLAAAALAGLLLSWVVGTDGISRLLNAVMDSIVADVSDARPDDS